MHERRTSRPARTREHGANEVIAFETHVPLEEAMAGVAAGTCVRGLVTVSPHNARRAYLVPLPPHSSGTDVVLDGSNAMNRAMHGDEVIARLAPLEQWPRRAKEIFMFPGMHLRTNMTDIELEAALPPVEMEAQRIGTVICIVRRRATLSGTLMLSASSSAAAASPASPQRPGRNGSPARATPDALRHSDARLFHSELLPKRSECTLMVLYETQAALLVPTDKRLPRVQVPLELLPAEAFTAPKPQLYRCSVQEWFSDSKDPVGGSVERLGAANELVARMMAIMTNQAFVPRELTEALDAEVKDAIARVDADSNENALDLTELLVFTIDPPTARDLDDALSIQRIGTDVYLVGVHIADASLYVPKDSLLDQYAMQQPSSVYLPQRAVHMLPPDLSEQCCSLLPHTPRRVLSVFCEMDKQGVLRKPPSFCRSLIRSSCRLSYDQAQAFIDGRLPADVVVDSPHTIEDVSVAVRMLDYIAQELRQRRRESGALPFNNRTEIHFSFDRSATYEPQDVRFVTSRDADARSHSLVEEFMLLANMSVANLLYQRAPFAFFRCQKPFNAAKLREVVAFCQQAGIDFDASSMLTIAESLLQQERKPQQRYAAQVLSAKLISAMHGAEYMAASHAQIAKDVASDVPELGHFTLNVPLYTHFTSPIRRYADLVAHRLVCAVLDKAEMPYTQGEAEHIAALCSEFGRRSKYMQRDIELECLASLLRSRDEVRTCDAIVLGVHPLWLEVYLPEYDLRRDLRCNELPFKCRPSEGKLTVLTDPPVHIAPYSFVTVEVRPVDSFESVQVVLVDPNPIELPAELEAQRSSESLNSDAHHPNYDDALNADD